MKKKITVLLLIVVISFSCGYWLRGLIYLPSGFSSKGWLDSSNYNQKFLMKDFEKANDLVQAWRLENYNNLHPNSSVVVVPSGGSSVIIRWHGLSDRQQDEIEKIVYDYFDAVIEENKKLTEQVAAPDG